MRAQGLDPRDADRLAAGRRILQAVVGVQAVRLGKDEPSVGVVLLAIGRPGERAGPSSRRPPRCRGVHIPPWDRPCPRQPSPPSARRRSPSRHRRDCRACSKISFALSSRKRAIAIGSRACISRSLKFVRRRSSRDHWPSENASGFQQFQPGRQGCPCLTKDGRHPSSVAPAQPFLYCRQSAKRSGSRCGPSALQRVEGRELHRPAPPRPSAS